MDSTAHFDRGTVTDVAPALFLARGFGSTTLDDIAEASGASVETISRVAIAERRKQTLPLALADHYGMDPDDPLILRTVRVWSAVVSGYAAGITDSADTGPARDLDDTRRMTRRLDHAFKHITGQSEF